MEASAEKTMPTGILEKRIFTIGHSNLSFEEFASLLKEFGICLIADIGQVYRDICSTRLSSPKSARIYEEPTASRQRKEEREQRTEYREQRTEYR